MLGILSLLTHSRESQAVSSPIQMFMRHCVSLEAELPAPVQPLGLQTQPINWLNLMKH